MKELLEKMTKEDRAILLEDPSKFEELQAKYEKTDEPEEPEGTDDKSKEYIKQLREEAKANRLKAKEAEERLKKLSAEAEAKQRAELEAKQEYEKLYNDLKTKMADYETLKGQLEQYSIREQKEKETLLKKLPPQIRDVFADAKIEQIRAAMEMQKTSMPASPGADGTATVNNGVDLSKMSIEQLTTLAQTNPMAYEQLILGKK